MRKTTIIHSPPNVLPYNETDILLIKVGGLHLILISLHSLWPSLNQKDQKNKLCDASLLFWEEDRNGNAICSPVPGAHPLHSAKWLCGQWHEATLLWGSPKQPCGGTAEGSSETLWWEKNLDFSSLLFLLSSGDYLTISRGDLGLASAVWSLPEHLNP